MNRAARRPAWVTRAATRRAIVVAAGQDADAAERRFRRDRAAKRERRQER